MHRLDDTGCYISLKLHTSLAFGDIVFEIGDSTSEMSEIRSGLRLTKHRTVQNNHKYLWTDFLGWDGYILDRYVLRVEHLAFAYK